ncbi:hypothetical protein H2200_006959 [Cladophialophora chaetospira]|uniref:Transcription factor domain-containing protein n=1 Tax=Cladophialophora chaetospira TaxID=386627 RepID=A0AA38X9B2_9EURO|nr:hypothetical protein H2200_006959 [Cladophialophora chaetospira]
MFDATKFTEQAYNAQKHGNIKPMPSEQPRASGMSQFEPRPAISLFDNALMARSGRPTTTSLADPEPSAFYPARSELLTTLPHEPDLNTLIELSKDWWKSAPHRFPELFSIEEIAHGNWRTVLKQKLSLANPAETAKVSIWTVISIERLDGNVLLYSTFQDPTALASLGPRILPVIDRVVVFDDDIGTTLSGLECLLLLSRYHCNHGRLQKAWHLCRRAIDFSISTGIHHVPIETGIAHQRRAEVWQAACFLDSYLSLLLGLPHGIRDSRLQLRDKGGPEMQNTPQGTRLVYGQITSIIDNVIDRNQKALEESEFLLSILQIDRELRSLFNDVDTKRWEASSASSDPHTQEAFERIEAYSLLHLVQALLHLPLMLKCIGNRDKGMCQFSYEASIGSSRQALVAYKYLRVGLRLDPYLCTMLDLQAFMMSVLLLLHLMGRRIERTAASTAEHLPEEDVRDWKSVTEVTDILRQVSKDQPASSVATQALEVLDLLIRAKNISDGDIMCPQSKANGGTGCHAKIDVPCFGDITLVSGIRENVCFCTTSAVEPEKIPSSCASSDPGRHVSRLDPSIFDITLPSPHDNAAAFDGNWNVLRGHVASIVAEFEN